MPPAGAESSKYISPFLIDTSFLRHRYIREKRRGKKAELAELRCGDVDVDDGNAAQDNSSAV